MTWEVVPESEYPRLFDSLRRHLCVSCDHPTGDNGLYCVRCDPPELEDAARAYVAARLANDGAEPKDWSARAAELERTWHNLVEASGLAMPEA